MVRACVGVVLFSVVLVGCEGDRSRPAQEPGKPRVAAPTTGPATQPSATEQADDLERRWAAQYLKPDDAREIDRLNAAATKLLPLIQPDGRFADLAYGEKITGRDGGKGWGEHLVRAVDLFTAWRTQGTRVAGDPAFAKQIRPTLETYLAAPVNKDDRWGFGHPYANLIENNRIGRICLFARSDPGTFSQSDIERWANHITTRSVHPIFVLTPDRKFVRSSELLEGGANLLWQTRGELIPYLISTDQDLRVKAIDAYMEHVWKSQTVRSAKGPLGQIERLTVDGMLGEHFVPAMGSYGEWYINAVVEYRDLVQGVPRWQMPAELNAHWTNILLDSMAHTYQGAVDPHLCNPLIWLNARRNGNAKLKEWLTSFVPAGHRREEVERFLKWDPGVTPWPNAQQSVRYFYTTDYMTKHYPRFMASVRAVSERTYGSETFGQKDKRWALESILLPLGTVFVRRDARDFQDTDTQGVFTAMDFARLPGQTTRHVSGAALVAAWNRDADGFAVRSVFGGTPFSGGVTTARTGVMGWGQSRYVNVDRDRPWELKVSDLSVNGRRAVFFLEDAIIHLGSGFDVRHDSLPTLTSLEQRASGEGNTIVAIGEQTRDVPRSEVLRDPNVSWVWRQDVGYIPPSDGVKVVQDVLQPGQPAKQVFSFWTDHGRDKKGLSFDWAVLPDVTAEEMPTRVANRSWQVVANTVNTQAVAVPAKGWLGVVFHAPGTLESSDGAITVDRPCVLIIERVDERVVVHASDPLQQGGDLVVRIGNRTLTMAFPEHPHLGKPVQADLR